MAKWAGLRFEVILQSQVLRYLNGNARHASNGDTVVNRLSASEIPLVNSLAIPGSQPSVEDHHSTECHDTPESVFATDDNFGDMEMQSMLGNAHRFLQGPLDPPVTNLDVPSVVTRTSEVSLDDSNGLQRNGLNLTAEGSDAGCVSSSSLALYDVPPRRSDLVPLTASQQKDPETVEATRSNFRKRKHIRASPEEYDGSLPKAANLSPGGFAHGGQQVSASRVLSPASDDLDAQSHLSPPNSVPESLSSDCSDEAIDGNGTDMSGPLGSTFSKITPKQVGPPLGSSILLTTSAALLCTVRTGGIFGSAKLNEHDQIQNPMKIPRPAQRWFTTP